MTPKYLISESHETSPLSLSYSSLGDKFPKILGYDCKKIRSCAGNKILFGIKKEKGLLNITNLS
jgi:hypothetical protein